MLCNYDALHKVWDAVIDSTQSLEIRSRVRGVKRELEKFNFWFGANLCYTILSQTDSLNHALQKNELSALEAQEMVKMVITILENDRNDDRFKLFFNKICDEAR